GSPRTSTLPCRSAAVTSSRAICSAGPCRRRSPSGCCWAGTAPPRRSDSAGETPLLPGAQIGVEGHGDVAQHQLALRQQHQPILIDGNQPVRQWLLQPGQGIGEIRPEVDLLAVLELTEVDAILAHQLQYQFPSQTG